MAWNIFVLFVWFFWDSFSRKILHLTGFNKTPSVAKIVHGLCFPKTCKARKVNHLDRTWQYASSRSWCSRLGILYHVTWPWSRDSSQLWPFFVLERTLQYLGNPYINIHHHTSTLNRRSFAEIYHNLSCVTRGSLVLMPRSLLFMLCYCRQFLVTEFALKTDVLPMARDMCTIWSLTKNLETKTICKQLILTGVQLSLKTIRIGKGLQHCNILATLSPFRDRVGVSLFIVRFSKQMCRKLTSELRNESVFGTLLRTALRFVSLYSHPNGMLNSTCNPQTGGYCTEKYQPMNEPWRGSPWNSRQWQPRPLDIPGSSGFTTYYRHLVRTSLWRRLWYTFVFRVCWDFVNVDFSQDNYSRVMILFTFFQPVLGNYIPDAPHLPPPTPQDFFGG